MAIPQKNPTEYFRRIAPLIFRIESYLPTDIIKRRNPLFDQQLRMLHWPRGLSSDQLANAREIRAAKTQALKRYTCRYGVIVPIICAFVGYFILFQRNFGDNLIGNIILFGPLALSLLCDLYYIVTAVNRITHQATLEQWELFRLTKLTDRDILLANLATIRIRVWRVEVIEFGIRLCITLMLLMLLVIPYGRYSSRPTLDKTFVLDLLLLLVLGIGYICEPLWRTRTVTLIGMAIASWMDSYATAIIVSLGALVGLLLLQGGLLFGCIWLFNKVLVYVYADYYDYNRVLFWQLILIVMIVGTMYLFFRLVQRAMFAWLTRVAFHA